MGNAVGSSRSEKLDTIGVALRRGRRRKWQKVVRKIINVNRQASALARGGGGRADHVARLRALRQRSPMHIGSTNRTRSRSADATGTTSAVAATRPTATGNVGRAEQLDTTRRPSSAGDTEAMLLSVQGHSPTAASVVETSTSGTAPAPLEGSVEADQDVGPSTRLSLSSASSACLLYTSPSPRDRG